MMQEFIYDNLKIGQRAEFSRFFSESNVNDFARISGDNNPLHTDNDYAQKTEFGGKIIHGMLAASLFSTLVGIYLPGKYCLYLSQTLDFRRPIRIGQKVKISGEVTEKTDNFKLIMVKTEIRDEEGKILINGLAKVKLLK